MSEAQRKANFMAFMMGEYKKYEEQSGIWRPSLIDWAKFLGISDPSLSHYMAGRRMPDLPNAIILSRKLGPQIFDVLEYEHFAQLDDPQLRFIAENWEVLSDETKQELLAVARRSTTGNSGG